MLNRPLYEKLKAAYGPDDANVKKAEASYPERGTMKKAGKEAA